MLAKIPLFAIRADRYPAPFLIDHSLPPSFSNLRLLSHASTIGALLTPIQWCLPDGYGDLWRRPMPLTRDGILWLTSHAHGMCRHRHPIWRPRNVEGSKRRDLPSRF